MNYKITKAANSDLEHIWLFTRNNWSVKQADRYLNLILDEIEHLALNPKSGKDYSNIRRGYFRSTVKSHFIFYKINQSANQIEIIRILHQRMNIDFHLKR